MIHLESRHWDIVKNILRKYPYTFYAFGSRVKGTHRPLSDLDLCFMEPIPVKDYVQLQEDFEESNLPFKVDLVDWNKCDDTFKKLIKKDLFRLDF